MSVVAFRSPNSTSSATEEVSAARLRRQSSATENQVSADQQLSKSRARHAAYSREWRKRARKGRVLSRLEVDEVSLIMGLLDRGLLQMEQADDREAVAKA